VVAVRATRPATSATDSEAASRILQDLIRIRTHQPEGNEKDLVKYILGLLSEEAFETTVIDHGGNRASLVAVLPGARSGALAFVGHLDTVSVGCSENWSHPPFAADIEDGRVYGRGAANMKGGLTAMILCAISLASKPAPPPRDIYFCFTADGDFNGYGARCLAEGGHLGQVQEFFFLDPTEGKIGIRQKGALWLDVRVEGRFSYSCFPELGLNAVEYLMEFTHRVEALLQEEFGARSNETWHPTCVLTRIESSSDEKLEYTVPNHARGFLDIRTLPGADHNRLVQKMAAAAETLGRENPPLQVGFDVVNNRLPIGMSANAPMVRKLDGILQDMGQKAEKKGLNFFTDASRIIPVLGVPFVIFGPGKDIFCTLREENVSIDSVLLVEQAIERYALESGAAP
jgi:succinyl-diaminopimelate desuccinylase